MICWVNTKSPTSQAVFCHGLVYFFLFIVSAFLFLFFLQCWNKWQSRAKASSSFQPPPNRAQPDPMAAPGPFSTVISMQMKSQLSLASWEYHWRGGTFLSLSLFPVPNVSPGDEKRALILSRSYLNWKRNAFAKLVRAQSYATCRAMPWARAEALQRENSPSLFLSALLINSAWNAWAAGSTSCPDGPIIRKQLTKPLPPDQSRREHTAQVSDWARNHTRVTWWDRNYSRGT